MIYKEIIWRRALQSLISFPATATLIEWFI